MSLIINDAQLYERKLWGRHDIASGGRPSLASGRNTLPADAQIKEAVEHAIAKSPDLIYLDDHHALSPHEQAQLILKVKEHAPNVRVVIYNWPPSSAGYARNLQKSSGYKWRARPWRWDTEPLLRVVDAACPSLYLRGGVHHHANLSIADAWQMVATDAVLSAQRTGLPIIPFLSILSDEANTSGVARRIAWCCKQWHDAGVIDGVVVWGNNQETLKKMLAQAA